VEEFAEGRSITIFVWMRTDNAKIFLSNFRGERVVIFNGSEISVNVS